MDWRKIAALGKTTGRVVNTCNGTRGALERRSATTKQIRSSVPVAPKVTVEARPLSGTSKTA
jgi:hypothetical protein